MASSIPRVGRRFDPPAGTNMGIWTPGPGATSGDDTYVGDGLVDVVSGLEGNDTLNGAGGNDTLNGDLGDDTLNGGTGADTLDGGDGFDVASYAGASAGVIADLGVESLNTGDAAGDIYWNIEGLIGSGRNDQLIGNDSDNFLDGSAGNDNLLGLFGNDRLEGGSGADTLSGEDGDDILNGEGDADTMTGGLGNDTYYFDNAGDIMNEAADEGVDRIISSFDFTLGANFEDLQFLGSAGLTGQGNALNNTLTGNTGANTLWGFNGADTLNGDSGADTLIGGLGNDAINGGSGNDIIRYAIGDGADTINGGANTDLVIIDGGVGAQTLDVVWNGAALTAFNGSTLTSVEQVQADLSVGIDTLRYTTVAAGVSVNIANSTASGFTTIVGVDNIVGSGAADLLVGATSDNDISGGGGNDQIFGFGGNDVLSGEDGDDLIVGEGGDDTINAGAGNDTIRYTLGHGIDTTDGGDGADTLVLIARPTDDVLGIFWNGTVYTSFKGGTLANIEQVSVDMGNGVDLLRFGGSTAGVTVNIASATGSGLVGLVGVEDLGGTAFDDFFTGNSDANALTGEDGNDTLVGLGGNDTLLGGAGIDTITGGGGDDTVDAGIGNDIIHYTLGEGVDATNGGAGIDTLIITGTNIDDVLGMIWNGSYFTSFKGGTLTGIEQATLDLGAGVDTLRYAGSSGNINVNLTAGTATGFTSIAGVENVIGATVVDNLTGDGNANNLDGQGGNDVLTGAGGDDVLTGSSGNDRFVFSTGSGADTVTDFDANAAGGGQDLVDITGYGITGLDFGARVVITDQGSDTLVTIDGGSTILFTGVDGDGDNVITQADFLLI